MLSQRRRSCSSRPDGLGSRLRYRPTQPVIEACFLMRRVASGYFWPCGRRQSTSSLPPLCETTTKGWFGSEHSDCCLTLLTTS
jgi:hypothetical protein